MASNGTTRGILGMRWTTKELKRDPAIDVYRTLYQKQHLKEDDLAALAGVSTSTVKKMFNNETMRPQHLTFMKLAAAMHHEYVLQPMTNGSGKPDYESEIVLAKEERKIYRLAQQKKRERAERRAKAK